MKSLILAIAMAVAAIGLTPVDVQAKRIGGGSSAGMQRNMPARSTPDAAPAKPAAPVAAPATAGAAATAAAPKRSWMGPLAGLAAGLGIAALMSHLGMGAGFSNFIMLALLALVAFFAIRFLLQRFGPSANARNLATPQGMQFAGAGGNPALTPLPASSGSGWGQPATVAPLASDAPPRPVNLPADFDVVGFERIAKMIFIRMQAANDSADLDDLRAFTTPEMFASVRLDLQDRAAGAQQTDVVKLDAEVLDLAVEAGRQIVSVRFHGLIREDKGGVANNFDEIWHLAKPTDGSRDWAIAGIQQSA